MSLSINISALTTLSAQQRQLAGTGHVTKMSGLSVNTQIFTKKGLPLLFKSSVGSLGKISIFIKSKDLIEKENSVLQESDEES